MSSTTPSIDVIVIGGGIAGASIAYQLTKRGQRILVLERHLLGSGSTGRAAGLLGQLRGTEAATRMMMDSLRIVREVEGRTGRQLFVETGSLRLATTPERAADVEKHVAFGKSLGLDIDLIGREELRRIIPHMRADDVLTASHCPTDGHLMPSELHDAFVALARAQGAEVRTRSPVEEIAVRSGRVAGVRCRGELIEAPVVVNATGPWSYLVAATAGATLQTCALGHYYITTAPDPRFRVDPMSPAVRDHDHRIYSRPEVGGILVGTYEAEPRQYEMADMPEDFDMSTMTAERDNMTVALLVEAAAHRFPFLENDVPFQVTHGIMTFTPNASPLCGEIPGAKGFFHCAGFSGHGIVRSPAIGVIMADLILQGRAGYDMEALRADRYFELPGFQTRAEIRAKGRTAYAGYYGGKKDPKKG
ncbi:MAG: FAD-binding oxidoreductase [Planctomycetes bacterium]|nr:FAD-binding oxidoreductase [Planctomycetota bacterium]